MEDSAPSLPAEILGKVFPLLRNDAKTWFHLARANKELYRYSSVLRGPQRWPELLVDWSDGALREGEESGQDNEEDDDVDEMATTTTSCLEHYVHQVKFSPNGRHMALMLRVYQGAETTHYQRLVRVIDIDDGPIHDILVGLSAPFSDYCQGEGDNAYLIVVEPRLVRMFAVHEQYREVRQIPSTDRIVGFKVLADLKAVLQIEQEEETEQISESLSVWNLLENQDDSDYNFAFDDDVDRRVVYNQEAGSFCVSQDARILACMQFGPYADRSVTIIYLDNDGEHRQYTLQIPGSNTRSWIDTCKFSPDGSHLVILMEERIYLANTAGEPPHWEEEATMVVPDRCTFSGQLQFSIDSTRLVAHARTPWDDIYYSQGEGQVCNTIQIWNVTGGDVSLVATKGFQGVAGSVGISQDAKLVVILEGDETDVYNAPIERIHTRYISVMDGHLPLLEASEVLDDVWD